MSKSAPSATTMRRSSRTRNPTDKVLGCFSNVEPSERLDHMIRYLSTWSGTDKCLMLTQYSSKLVIVLLNLQYALRLRMLGMRSTKTSSAAQRVQKLGSLISDARVLYRIWGILPIIKWMIGLERSPPPTRLLHNIERIQGWSMLAYCPMEAIAYLGSHGIVSVPDAIQNGFWLWGSRFWALYVGLQLLHLVEDNRLLRLRAKALERSRGHPTPNKIQLNVNAQLASASSGASTPALSEKSSSTTQEQAITRRMWDELDDRKAAILNELWVNLGYLPLTIHWSCTKGLISEGWVGLFGTIAALAGLRSGWKNSAAPPVPPATA
ncbi:uncharacterized protein UMAG_00440 [Mycosarcoma maydis]|uniref:Uncharacterized protein n=1 Tax=Mycosarcoma maydis TaxID=5270 RepID=A0A0D1D0U5_MYCMD|nr:uncharacterized protein UMAG_00440 [Ustilago maydis 521]KIS72018.1 hypothetical protein UMAG_00440 [Ustilago maydis 521]|eukprot:XP_011386307.1 hypothetical protein UMAG_00440 [Ustilago maydis 521]